jgi:MoaA/NifB/PqqE/SkfB family radical SAM enzyme
VSDLRVAASSALLFWKQRSRLPQTLIFFVTSRCNARCDFCLYGAQVADPVAAEDELTVEEVRRIAASYGDLHYLALSGGEPFVREDVGELCQAFVDRCGTAVIDIPSNFAFGDRMVQTLGPLAEANPGVVFDLQLSIDHVGERHDASRAVAGLYDRARETARQLAPLRRRLPNLKLKASVVWLERNRDDLEAIVAAIRRDFDCDRIQLSYPNCVLEAGGDSADVAAFRAAARRLDRSLPLRRISDLHTLGMRSVKELYGELLADAASGRRRTGSYCDVGRILAVLDEKGDVFCCEPLWESVGNVRDADYDLGAVLAGDAARRFRAERLGPDRCSCTWGCAMHSWMATSPRCLPRLGGEAVRIVGRSLVSGRGSS